ncbi:ATP-dependent endonuclease [Synergistales bacterium]|nr:ATP-dependent endonuclease [Synergistales bacterium]
MHITKIRIQNYRNFSDFSMEFQKGLNVIIGSNNSGKTGLLYAIRMLSKPEITSAHDFNKNVIAQFTTAFQEDAPKIVFEFEIRHEISEDDTEDESIVKLVPFLGMETIETARKADNEDNNGIYGIIAVVRMTFSLDLKSLADYQRDVKTAKTLEDFVSLLDTYLERFTWSFTNGTSETESDKKDAVGIFDIRFIGAERTSADVAKETKHEIDVFSRDQNNAVEIQKLKQTLSEEMKKLLEPALGKMSLLFENENNEIGLNSGNVSIFQNIRPDIRIADAYVTDVKDTKGNYVVPLENNGLGYNNLINIYMLIKLNEIRKGKDFRILCLEEPEAHLHPAMQYKLFKFLRMLDETDKLNQQVFVTTHSSNVSAVAGIDNMYMLDYYRSDTASDCCQQSLEDHFRDKGEAKKHLTKFLDVTRSDMLFADRVILVEGIAEKLLLPLFMEKCGCAYEDGNISIVEIGGKHFEHFIELFNGNAVYKKVLCITDKDFKWFDGDGSTSEYERYTAYETPHIKKFSERFSGMGNLKIVSQTLGGSTFEDELLLSNFDSYETTIALLKLTTSKTVIDFIGEQGIDLSKWKDVVLCKVKECVKIAKDNIDAAILSDEENAPFYRKLFFGILFWAYAESQKGNVALDILSDDELAEAISVPPYIKEGLEWLSK